MRYVVLILALLATGCKSSSEPSIQAPAPTPVYAEKPQMADVPLYVEALGSLRASTLVDVRPRLTGIVSQVHVHEGQWVEEGMSLFQIDPKPYAIKVQQVTARLGSAKARLHAAQNKHERFKTLADKNLISQNEWEQIETEVLQAKAEVELDVAILKEAKLELEYCTICAHKSGRVGTVDIHPGHLVAHTQAEPLVQIATMDPIVAEFALTEKEFCQLSDETKDTELTTLSAPETSYQGKLSFTDNHFDETSGLILLRAKIANPEYRLRPGMSVKVRIPVGIIKGALLVPQKAIKHNEFGAFVYVVQEDSSVALSQVQTAGEFGQMLIIQSGLTPDDVVITEGHQKAAPGSKVEIK